MVSSSSGSPETPSESASADGQDRPAGLVPRLKARVRVLRRRWGPAIGPDVPDGPSALDEEYVREKAQQITTDDVKTVLERAEAIEQRFQDHGPLQRLLEDGRLLLGLVRDVRRGRYRAVPAWTLGAAAVALLYVLNPMDAVPDALPVIGLLDDAAVVSACLALLEQDLHRYRRWRRQHQEEGGSDDE